MLKQVSDTEDLELVLSKSDFGFRGFMNFKIVIFILKSGKNRNPDRKTKRLYAQVFRFTIWITIYPSISGYTPHLYFKIEIGWFQIAIFPFYN